MVFMPHWPKPIGFKQEDFGLDRIVELLEKLGNPQEKLPPVVHIAGTNGKGSTVAFMRSIYESAGYKVHVYTSPHLLNFNERIVLAGKEISNEYLHDIAEEVRTVSESSGINITFFEATTAMAFLAFSRIKADIVLLETGMGGRLDATNIVKKPALTILSPISMDHMEYLGPTIEFIAREKVEIFKDGVPSVSSLQTEEVQHIIEEMAEKRDSVLFSFGYDWIVEKKENGFIFRSQFGDIDLPLPSLSGDHQLVNAGTAIISAKIVEGFKISDEDIKRGIANAVWPARLQQIKKGRLLDLLPEGWEIWIDGAHNASGAQVLSCFVEDWAGDKPVYIICGFTRNRDPKEILKFFLGKVEYVGGVLVETEPSASSGEKIAEAAESIGFKARGFDSIEDAIFFFKNIATTPGRILFCGSLYLASDALKANK